MRRWIVPSFLVAALSAAAWLVLGGSDGPVPSTVDVAEPGEEEDATAAAAAEPGAAGLSRGGEAGRDASPTEEVARDAAPVAGEREEDAVLSGIVYDLGRRSGTVPFAGATVEVRDVDSAFAARLARDTLRGLDFARWSRHRPSTVLSSIADLSPSVVVTTDAEGRFRAEGVRPRRSTSVRILADGYVPVELAGLFPAPGEERDLGRIDLLRGGEVAGRVLDEHDRPVKNADVLLGEDVAAESGEDGRFLVSGLRSGVVSLRARRPGEMSTLAPTRVVVVRTNDRVEDVRLLLPVGVELLGRVVDQHRVPVRHAIVTARFEKTGESGEPAEGSTHTEADGRFLIRGLPSDARPDVSILHPSAPELLLEEVDPRAPLDVTLERSPRLRVRIVRAGSDVPVEPSWVRWTVRSVRKGEQPPRTVEEEELRALAAGPGIVDLPMPEPGDVSLSARAPLYVIAETERPTPVDGQNDAGPITLELRSAPPIQGFVVDLDQRPIPGATVTHVDPDFRAVAATTSRSDGAFVLVREADEGKLLVLADGYARATGSLLGGWIVLEPENLLVGTVTGFDGRPAPDFGLLVFGPLGVFLGLGGRATETAGLQNVFVARTDAAGRYRVSNLPVGRFLATAVACAPIDSGVEAFARGRTTLDLDLRQSYGTLRGDVFVDDLPADGVRVRLGTSVDALEVSTAPGGAYRFPILPVGTHELSVERDGCPLGAPETVVITGGAHLERRFVVQTSSVHGRLDGQAGPRAIVRLAPYDPPGRGEQEVLADGEGNFEFVDVAVGNYALSARAAGWLLPPTFLRVAPGANRTDPLSMQRATHLVLRLPEGGPWRADRLLVNPSRALPFAPRITKRPDGTLLLEGLPAGRSTLDVELTSTSDDPRRAGRPRGFSRRYNLDLSPDASHTLSLDP